MLTHRSIATNLAQTDALYRPAVGSGSSPSSRSSTSTASPRC
ncbi:hypothetical protein ACFQ0M_07285 [Kitasatospora aburaviensis]